MPDHDLILASASPRRRELLATLGVQFAVQSADLDETVQPGERAAEYVERLARAKASAIAAGVAVPVLAADTSVVIDDDILGKPADHFDALAMLARLSGRSHEVLTGIALHSGNGVEARVVTTKVRFASLSRETCEAYLATDEPWDKAGSYGIQGLAGAFVEAIEGSYSNVVGLPLNETWQLLQQAGISTALSGAAVPGGSG